MYMDTMIMMEQVNLKLENFEKMITDMFSEQMNFDMHCFKKVFILSTKVSQQVFSCFSSYILLVLHFFISFNNNNLFK